jgi:4-amino-4-deoxy-L-arabinose transferase-like glycosyltransferase
MTFLHGSTFLEEIFIQRNLIHYFTEKWQHPGPVYYYLPIIFAGAFPWSVALVWGAAITLRSALPNQGKTHDWAEKI